MDISGSQKMRWSYLPYQQREALKFVWDHIYDGPIHYDGSILFRRSDVGVDYTSLRYVSKRTLKELVRHKLIRIDKVCACKTCGITIGKIPWKITLKPLGREWGAYPMDSQK